jgi:hypothetical protein
MSDFLKKCEEIEAKLKKVAEEKAAPVAVAKPQPVRQPVTRTVSNALSRAHDNDDRKAAGLANTLFKMMSGPIAPQPTDQELFGRFVVTQEQADAADAEWRDKIGGFFREVQKPIHKSTARSNDFGRTGPIKESDLTEEERRILEIPVDPKAYKVD